MNHTTIGTNFLWVERWISGGIWVWSVTGIIIILAVLIFHLLSKRKHTNGH
jgi:amino acid transporter